MQPPQQICYNGRRWGFSNYHFSFKLNGRAAVNRMVYCPPYTWLLMTSPYVQVVHITFEAQKKEYVHNFKRRVWWNISRV